MASPYIIDRLFESKWNVEQTIVTVKAVLAEKPPRGYEELFAVERLQEMAAAGQDPTEVTRLAVRALITMARSRLGTRQILWDLDVAKAGWRVAHRAAPEATRIERATFAPVRTRPVGQDLRVDAFRISIYAMDVISSFKDAETEKIFQGLRSRSFEAIAKTAYRKLAILHSARTLHDLKSPGLLLEALKDDRAGQHSIRINDRYRVCFEWRDGEASNVEIVDYH